MKNHQKGFIVPLLIIVALVLISGGVYIANRNKIHTPSNTAQSEIQSTTTVSTNEVLSNNVSNTSTTSLQATSSKNKNLAVNSYINCDSSDVCFSEKVKTCTLAKATISDQAMSNTYLETVEGYNKNNDCIVTLAYTYIASDGPTNYIGKKMTCGVPISHLSNYKEYLQGDQMKASCTGPLIDLLIEMGAK